MTNRIREFRNKKGLSQKDFVQAFNKYLNVNKIKSITIPTFSRWENSLNSPTRNMWNVLASFMNIPVIVLQGAYSKDEILKLLQEDYINKVWYVPSKGKWPTRWWDEIPFNVDLVAMAYGIVPYDIPLEHKVLSDKQVNDLNFWRNNFSFIFNSLAIKWLITRPIDVTKDEILQAINESLKSEIFILENDEITKTKVNGKWSNTTPKDNLKKRQQYIDSHLFYDEDGADYFDWNRTHPLNNKTYR